MATLRTNHLTTMQLGRLNKALAKRARYDGVVRTLAEHIATLPAKKHEGNGLIRYSRTRFNRMNAKEQTAYMARMEAERHYYIDGWEVPKIVYDCVVE